MVDMVDRLSALTRTQVPLPLIDKFYNMDAEGQVRFVFIATDRVNEAALAPIRALRASRDDVAIVVFYSSGDPNEEVLALEAGADDCITIPFDFAYLYARLRATGARLRRSSHPQQTARPIDVDLLTHQALVDGHSFPLSPLEFRFLLELRRQRGKMVPHEDLEKLLWGENGPASHQCMKQLVRRLRSRLGEAAESITCIHGAGYILR
ncbi:MAG TPA: winged helix-turn-helix domain-containing protein [Dehalococcoidia bacterium]|nr:winged helix-turn-helix domain-containing protein [Dehalococcoidia bacterium]